MSIEIEKAVRYYEIQRVADYRNVWNKLTKMGFSKFSFTNNYSDIGLGKVKC